ncbi:hypothetical protein [Photobacterium damselae]|uniref:hypothetical protein n=1 Tax=Photobacterium damselae TaxID=38293 RepID=UPI0025436613
MNKKVLEALASKAAKSIKTESDLDDFCKMLTTEIIKTAVITKRFCRIVITKRLCHYDNYQGNMSGLN